MSNPTRRRPGSPEPLPPPRRRRNPFDLLRWARNAVLLVAVLGLVGWAALFYALAPELPSFAELRKQSEQPIVTVRAADGEILARRGTTGARFVELDAISRYMAEAVIATEDRRFFQHFGLDLIGTARAIWANLRAGAVVEGGSSITQQLAKNLYLTPEQSLRRKLQELMLAVWLETQLDKKEILALYLNRVYFGAGAYGVEAAAQRYFAKPARRLTLPEAALLAGLLKAPSRLAPTNDIDLARDRALVVLGAMERAGFITEAEARGARLKPARVAPEALGELAGYFVDWTLDELEELFGKTTGDLAVETTIEPALQKAAEAAVRSVIDARAVERGASEAAVVVLDQAGAIRAYVGGKSYRGSAFDRAGEARRQPGSAFKPFVFLAALEAGMTPESRFVDQPTRFGSYEPRNYTGRYLGPVTLGEAFARSVNTVAVQVSERVGREKVIEAARRCGITSPLRPVPSLALGAFEVTLLELTASYQPLASGGVRHPPYGITAVKDSRGRNLYRHVQTGVRVAERQTMAELRQLMVAAIENGTGRAALLDDRRAGGKTGTTQNLRDAWFVGFAGGYVAGVWVGNDAGTPMDGVSGSGLPAQLWREVMRTAPEAGPQVASVTPERRPTAPPAGDDGFDWLLDWIDKTFGGVTQ